MSRALTIFLILTPACGFAPTAPRTSAVTRTAVSQSQLEELQRAFADTLVRQHNNRLEQDKALCVPAARARARVPGRRRS